MVRSLNDVAFSPPTPYPHYRSTLVSICATECYPYLVLKFISLVTPSLNSTYGASSLWLKRVTSHPAVGYHHYSHPKVSFVRMPAFLLAEKHSRSFYVRRIYLGTFFVVHFITDLARV